MKVIGVEQYGGPEALQVIERDVPQPERGQVRIRVEFAGVNPVDAMVRSGELAGWFGDIEPPFVPGMDMVGIVDAIGDGTDTTWSVGDRAVAIVDNFGAYGAYSQLVCVPAASLVSPPEGSSLQKAGSFLMNAMTARCTVDALASLEAGVRVLVTGAAGAVGANAVALAVQDGFEVTGLASERDSDFIASLGATAATSAADLDGRFAGLVDTAGTARSLIDHVEDGGIVAVVQPDIPEFDRDITVTHVNVRDRVTDTAGLKQLAKLAATGVLPLRVADVIPAIEAATAHEKLAERGRRGRDVLDFTTLN